MLLWPILWWQLNLVIRWMRDAKVSDVCFQTNAWGFITIRYAAFQPDPSLYRPVEQTFRELSDPSWESNLPANLIPEAAEGRLALILPRKNRGGVTEGDGGGARLSPIQNILVPAHPAGRRDPDLRQAPSLPHWIPACAGGGRSRCK